MEHAPKLNLPSTPPLLNLSPDLRNLKAFFKSPNAASEDDTFGMELENMDFESAYELLTQSPTYNFVQSPQTVNSSLPINATTATATLPTSPLPIHITQDNNDHHFRDFLLRTRTPSPRPNSPLPMFDLETLQQFPKYTELLSVNETTALEQFLDSIIDDPQKSTRAHTENQTHHLGEIPPTIVGSSHTTDTVYDASMAKQEIEIGRYTLPPVDGAHIGTVQLRSSPDPGNESTESKSGKRQRKRRRLLTEDEKKMHHTTSEQRRRGMIKESFEDLVKLLPLNQKKKNQSKSIVLETAAEQIERLVAANEELKKQLERMA